jgi:SAM-dependent methyltransferase
VIWRTYGLFQYHLNLRVTTPYHNGRVEREKEKTMSQEIEPYITKCPLGCKASLKTTDIILPEGCLLCCTECGQLISQCSTLQFLETMTQFNTFNGTWPNQQSANSHRRSVAKFLSSCKRFLKCENETLKLLDVGCSSGAFLHTARELGVQGVGVEPSPKAAKAAKDAGLDVHQGFLEEIPFAPMSFDVITLFEVIEHLREPISLLNTCQRLLRPGGILFLKTGNTVSWTARIQKGEWHYFNIQKHGGHISFFNPVSISVLARKAGFSPLEIITKSVEIFDYEQFPSIFRRPLKMFTELLQLPAKLSGNGQELFVFLRKS